MKQQNLQNDLSEEILQKKAIVLEFFNDTMQKSDS